MILELRIKRNVEAGRIDCEFGLQIDWEIEGWFWWGC
jgi:hypothetical protein